MLGRPTRRKGVLPIIVSSIIKKRRGGRTYLYAATSARVEGQPRIVDQVHLGAEDEVIARLTAGPGGDPSLPDTEHRRFGAVAAVWGMLQRLDAITGIDSVVGGTPVSGGVSVGTYLGLAALNRVCEPKSQRAFADWWTGTALGRITRIRSGALDHRRFWDAMDAVTVEGLEQIEAALTRRMIEVFALDTHALIGGRDQRRDPRRRHPAAVAGLSGQPGRRHRVRRDDRGADRSLHRGAGRGGRDHAHLRHRPELRTQRHPPGRAGPALRRVGPTE